MVFGEHSLGKRGPTRRPSLWQPPIELSATEQGMVKRCRRAKLFTFVRQQRQVIFSDAFPAEVASVSKDSPLGYPPIPPAQLALATILQADTGVSDDEVIEATTRDWQWQLVLAGRDCAEPPFSTGPLGAFRQRMIDQNGDRRLIERTIEIAEQTKEFGSRALRAALDSSPLWGAGKVEDTSNLLGHALRKALSVIARQQGRGLAEVADQAGAEVVGGRSLKAALDLDWDTPKERTLALQQVLRTLATVEQGLAAHPVRPPHADDPTPQRVAASLEAVQQIAAQDVETTPEGTPTLTKGGAKERRISIEDEQMRHGRKSRSQRVNGFKRHVVPDLDREVIRAVGGTAATVPEATVTADLDPDLAAPHVVLAELPIDRASLTSHWVRDRDPSLVISCKAWPVRNHRGFPKTAFTLDWEKQIIRCPNQVAILFHPGQTVHFPEADGAACPVRERCTSSVSGHSGTIPRDELLLAELRERQHPRVGRAKLRERVKVEHSLAHVGHWQGDRARYLGLRKNLFDLRRSAVVSNLHSPAHSDADARAAELLDRPSSGPDARADPQRHHPEREQRDRLGEPGDRPRRRCDGLHRPADSLIEQSAGRDGVGLSEGDDEITKEADPVETGR
jgi:hypothetical protein